MRSKDRLEEFRRLAQLEVYADTVCAVPAYGGEYDAQHKEIEDIFEEVERVRSWIHEVRASTQLMRRLHADDTFHNNRQLQEQLDGAAARAGGAGLKVAGALRQLEARAASAGAGAARRIARLHFAAARRQFADALDAHHALLAAVRDDQRRLLHQQLQLVNMTVSDEECQRLLDTDNIAFFVDNVHAETAEAKRALRDAEERRDELLRVERAIAEVRDLFVQMGHLVATQQNQVDTVEYYALQATEFVDNGQQHLLQGSVTHKRAQKKKWGLILCLAAGGSIVLLVLIFT